MDLASGPRGTVIQGMSRLIGYFSSILSPAALTCCFMGTAFRSSEQ